MAKQLKVTIVGDSKSGERALRSLGSSAERFSGRVASSFKNVAKWSAILVGGAALGGLGVTLHAGAKEWAEHARVAAQTAQVLKTTGGVANVTQKHVEALAGSMLAKTGIDDEAIQTTENLLLGFTNLHNEVGKGNAIFDRATMAVEDYAVRTGKDASKAAITFGRALNDPAKNLGALTRYGLQFTDAQKKQIAALEKSGHMLAAQKLVLGAVEERYKGAAEAAGRTLPGKLNILRETFRNLAGDLVGRLAPAASVALGFVDKVLNQFMHAKGARAKLDVVWDSVKSGAGSIEQAVSGAIAAIDWSAAWSKARGIGEGLAARFDSIDWGDVGTKIGNGLAAAVQVAITNTKGIPTALATMFDSVNFEQLGRKAGPGIAVAVASAIAAALDPAFWIRNWDLALALGLAFFTKGVGRIAGRLALPLVKVFGDALLEVVATIERFSPRIAAAILATVLRLPALVERALAPLIGVVSRVFGRLGGLARFALKVLGIEAAINLIVQFAQTVKGWIDRVVAWFKGLPGRIRGALAGVSLADIGSAIVGSLWDGLKSKWGAVEGWLGGLGGRIRNLKGPKTADAVLLVENGRAIMAGLQRGLASGWGDNETFLKTVAGRLQSAMNRLQAQLDATQARASDRSNQQALSDAQKQLAEATKKGKGVAAAERSVQDALQQIRDTAAQRELDRLTRQHDKILAKINTLKQRAADKLQKLRDQAGSAFDELAAKIQRAFQAKSDAFVAPAQAAIDAITRSQQQDDLVQAVSDAQAAVADAVANGGDILGAQRQLQRAQSDLLINGVGGLQDQAGAQQRAHDQAVDAQSEALDKMLAKLRTKLTEQGATWDDAMQGILGIIGSYDGDFASIGTLLGNAFVASLRDAMNAAAGASVEVKGGGGGSASGSLDVIGRMLASGNRILHLASGGDVTRSGFAFVHAGEHVAPGSASAVPLRGGFQMPDGDVIFELDGNEIGRVARREILRIGGRNVTAGLR